MDSSCPRALHSDTRPVVSSWKRRSSSTYYYFYNMRTTLVVLFFFYMSGLCSACTSCDAFDVTQQVDSLSYSYCESWRVNAEMHNLQNWKAIPSGCEEYTKNYMAGGQYEMDMDMVCKEAQGFAKSVLLQGNGKDAWIFDIDDTALSNLEFYKQNHFGAVPFNRVAWNEWENQAIAPAIVPVYNLYRQLLAMEWSIFFLTGRDELRRNVTVENLVRSGYDKWDGLILRQEGDRGLTALAYKSAKRLELEEQGYRIRGNMGDQWSDLIGLATGERAFKIPNPMYYIS